MKYLKSELALTKLAERNTWETWEKNERRSIAEYAVAESDRILSEHQVPPLEPQQEKELDAIMAAAEKEMVRKPSQRPNR
jgi:trimethylamine:corrinoid methyltransferase-like protein